MDRPAVAAGRMPVGDNEAVVSVDLADARGIEVGDPIPLTFTSRRDDMLAQRADVVTPVGVEHPTVVGIVTFPDEVLADELYPHLQVVVSPDLAERYDCLADVPPADAPEDEVMPALLPDGCATAYRYYSLELDGGDAGVAAAEDAFLREGEALNATLPPTLRDAGIGYFMIASTTADEKDRVERSLQPTVTALGVLAAAAGVVTVGALGLAAARELRRSEHDQRQWWQLGLTRRERTAVVLLPLAGAIAVGLVVALALAWLLSPVGPVGSVRSVEPSPARQLSGWVAVVALALAGACLVMVAALAARAARRVRTPDARRSDVRAVRRLFRASNRPAVDEGVRAAYGGRGAGLVLGSCGLATGVFLAAAVFGASLSSVLAQPATYGWPWDVGILAGYGYGQLDRWDDLRARLDARDDIASWTGLGLTNDVSVDGEPVLAVVALDQRAGVDFSVVEGRPPRTADEVALGTRTADERGVGVGDHIELRANGIEPRRVTVTGLAVLPPLGQFEADRAAPGEGMVLPATTLGRGASALITFVGIDLAPGADGADVLASLREGFTAASDVPPLEYDGPVRPAEIINVRSMRAAPLLVGGLLASSAAVGLTVAVVVSVRARRRDLAVLRALGFTGRQVRTSIRVQALATMAAALLVGVPLGVAAGRVAWRAFAFRLGVVADASTPVWWIVVTVAGSLAVALAAATIPARLAAQINPARALSTE
jgi:hypothetical protein